MKMLGYSLTEDKILRTVSKMGDAEAMEYLRDLPSKIRTTDEEDEVHEAKITLIIKGRPAIVFESEQEYTNSTTGKYALNNRLDELEFEKAVEIYAEMQKYKSQQDVNLNFFLQKLFDGNLSDLETFKKCIFKFFAVKREPLNESERHDIKQILFKYVNYTEHMRALRLAAAQSGLTDEDFIDYILQLSRSSCTALIINHGLLKSPQIISRMFITHPEEEMQKRIIGAGVSAQEWVNFFKMEGSLVSHEDFEKFCTIFSFETFENVFEYWKSHLNSTMDNGQGFHKFETLLTAKKQSMNLQEESSLSGAYDIQILPVQQLSKAVGNCLTTADGYANKCSVYHFKLGLIFNICAAGPNFINVTVQDMHAVLNVDEIEKLQKDYAALEKSKADLMVHIDKSGHHIINEYIRSDERTEAISIAYHMHSKMLFIRFGSAHMPKMIPFNALGDEAHKFIAELKQVFSIRTTHETAPKILSLRNDS